MNIENDPFCQSCSRPLDKSEILGTEKDGSKNREYCRYCYKAGAFTEPSISLETNEGTCERANARKEDGRSNHCMDRKYPALYEEVDSYEQHPTLKVIPFPGRKHVG